MAQLTIWQSTPRERDIPVVHIANNPATLISPIPEVVGEIGAKDAVYQIVQNLVTDASQLRYVDGSESFLELQGAIVIPPSTVRA